MVYSVNVKKQYGKFKGGIHISFQHFKKLNKDDEKVF